MDWARILKILILNANKDPKTHMIAVTDLTKYTIPMR